MAENLQDFPGVLVYLHSLLFRRGWLFLGSLWTIWKLSQFRIWFLVDFPLCDDYLVGFCPNQDHDWGHDICQSSKRGCIQSWQNLEVHVQVQHVLCNDWHHQEIFAGHFSIFALVYWHQPWGQKIHCSPQCHLGLLWIDADLQQATRCWNLHFHVTKSHPEHPKIFCNICLALPGICHSFSYYHA